ncbi:MAG: 50S ribosomal protein L25 [Patescibacteria group bacterium]|jgi:large subunit ribosomal protein L25
MKDTATLVLNANTRTGLKKICRTLRQQGFVPGVVYGHGLKNCNVQFSLKELAKVYQQAGDSTLIDLIIDNKPAIKALIQDVSYDILSDIIQHVDIHVVNMQEAIHAEIPLNFIGVAPAIKELNGILLKNKEKINVKCLPQDLIKELAVDISLLKTFTDIITVTDLAFPKAITVLDKPEETVVKVTPPRSDEELAALNQTVQEDVTKVAGVVKEPKEPTAGETTDKNAKETKKEAKK